MARLVATVFGPAAIAGDGARAVIIGVLLVSVAATVLAFAALAIDDA
ncbi:hypothetical protein [Actinoplanes regularis]|nr:hypothetical protein [Actinoplanes regularis]GLW30393.1 hypothetical protein Areg01_33330 [Actinoplanes regularis]